MTPLRTSVLVTAPPAGLSVTSAPALVTATMPGSAEAGALELAAGAEAGGLALDVTVLETCPPG
jgi:hypothetical protein